MQLNTHPVSPEEVMAFFDDQLPGEESKAVALHIAECWECQMLLDDFKKLSGSLQGWTVGEPARVLRSPAMPSEPDRPRWLWVAGSIAAAATLAMVLLVPSAKVHRAKLQETRRMQTVGPNRERFDLADPSMQVLGGGVNSFAPRSDAVAGAAAVEQAIRSRTSQQMIVRTADLALTASPFEPARAGIERIAKQYNGYLITATSTISYYPAPTASRGRSKRPCGFRQISSMSRSVTCARSATWTANRSAAKMSHANGWMWVRGSPICAKPKNG